MSPASELLGGFGNVVGNILVVWQVFGRYDLDARKHFLFWSSCGECAADPVCHKQASMSFLAFFLVLRRLSCHSICDRTTSLLAWLGFMPYDQSCTHMYVCVLATWDIHVD